MVKLVLGGCLRVIALYVAGMSEALVSVRVFVTCCSTVALPQSTLLVVRVTLGPTATAWLGLRLGLGLGLGLGLVAPRVGPGGSPSHARRAPATCAQMACTEARSTWF